MVVEKVTPLYCAEGAGPRELESLSYTLGKPSQVSLFLPHPLSTRHFSFSRGLILEGMTGGLVVCRDRPHYWDAWGELCITNISRDVYWADVDSHHLETAQALEFSECICCFSGSFTARAEVRVWTV